MTGNKVKEEEMKPGTGVGGLPEEPLVPQYRLWAFVMHKSGIRALCWSVEWKWTSLQSPHSLY